MSDIAVLSIKENSQIDALLSQFYLLASHLAELQERYVNHLLRLPDLIEHQDFIHEMKARAQSVKNLARTIEEDSIIITDVAKQIKTALMQAHHLKNDHELLPEQAATFSQVEKLEPSFKSINDTLSFCLMTIDEIDIRTQDKNKVIAEETIREDLKDISARMNSLQEQTKTISAALAHLSHLNHKYVQNQFEGSLKKDVAVEQVDLQKLRLIFASCCRQLQATQKELWYEQGREKAATILTHNLLPLFQQALAYDAMLTKIAQHLRSKNIILERYQIGIGDKEQQQIDALGMTIRAKYQELNTKVVPGLLSMLKKNDQQRLQVFFKQLIALMYAFLQQVLRIERCLAAIQRTTAVPHN